MQGSGRNGQWAERIAHAGSEAVYSAARQTLIPLGGCPGTLATLHSPYARTHVVQLAHTRVVPVR